MARRSYLGEAEIKVIKYLAENPKKNKEEIQISAPIKNYSTTFKAVDNLRKKSLVQELDSYIAKGNRISLWGLSFWGVFKSFETDVDTIKTFKNYEAFYPDLKWLRVCFQILEEEIGDKWVKNRAKLIGNLSSLGDRLAELGVTDKGIIVRTWAGYTQGFLESINTPPSKMRKFSKRMMGVLGAKTEADLLELLKKS